ncbi:MAG: ATP-binding cassette domain-containing protein [Clostridia bacterium]|nr:ATP-binding cassette domain-containing protein [Clostridia bacterium]
MDRTETKEIAVKVHNLNKAYGSVKAVEALNFEVYKTECLGLLGPNGAGKSTTMRMLYGQSIPDEAEGSKINVLGLDPARESLKIKALAGVVPQKDNLDSELNVEDNLLIYARFYGQKPKEAKVRIEELLNFMELQDKKKARIHELSGGMQRRLIIARALLNNPHLLILDEPTTGLDPQVRHLIWNKLRELQVQGVTILLSTHYMEEAFQICDRVIIMDKGKKILEGPPRELLASQLEKYVMEIHAAKETLDQYQASCSDRGLRSEYFQDTLFVYSNLAEDLAALEENLASRSYYLRPANLEDLFLKVTGRTLNELQ